jgi:hypothetical protein
VESWRREQEGEGEERRINNPGKSDGAGEDVVETRRVEETDVRQKTTHRSMICVQTVSMKS